MKSILFFSRFFVGQSTDNLALKFRSQISSAIKMGFDVWYVGIDGAVVSLYHGDSKYFLCKLITIKIPTMSNIVFYYQFYTSVFTLLKIKRNFDFIYARSLFASNTALRALKALKNTGAKIVVEIPSSGVNELKTEKRTIRKVILQVARKRSIKMAKYVDLYALIGKTASRYNGRPAVNISNGVDVEAVPLRRPINANGIIHILVLASMSRWHGYDRLIEGLREYKEEQNNTPLIVHFVGSDGDGSLLKWKNMVDEYDLNSIVVFEGSKYGNELSYFFDLCDVGVASLGLHRISNSMIYTLKIREYMARGLPFVYAYEDDSLQEQSDYYLKVPNDESPINIEKIVGFAIRNKRDLNGPVRMREHAKLKMTWESQFEIIFNWFSKQLKVKK